MKLSPIGIVHSNYSRKTKHDYLDRVAIEAKIEIYHEFVDGLFKLEKFNELWILFWFTEIDEQERQTLRVHPRRNPDNPERGVFSTRSPARPNPIGLTKVKLLKIEKNILTVKGLDAFDNTLILDIKEV
ncbi:tRNA (N6-threonylcarbamoyladenosine(37)-N6)-methyltransferase TrmO [Candidatus Dependentiae bacterium]|nr:tRNA (N6-threonylcarbamoyladenosine(37)-N6)-methyltransferase TrmO [Candidatus Dependentiae bacterium]